MNEFLRRNESACKWVVLASVIAGLEAVGREPLTTGVRKGLKTKIGSVAIPGAIAYTTAHFYNVLPHQPIETDLYSLMGRLAMFNRKDRDGTV